MSNASDAPNSTKGDVSLGPACMVVGIFGLVGMSLFFVYMSIMLMGHQGKTAARSVREQLIPWVEQSLLDQSDRRSIIDRLATIADQMEREELTNRQLSRLGIRLTESTILQWGSVEQLNRIAQGSSLSEEEKKEFALACDRWLHCASLGQLNMQDMEFAMQGVCTKEVKSGRLVPREDLDAQKLRDFMGRIIAICDRFQIPNEEFHKSVSQVFQQVVEEGLAEK